MSDGEHNLGLCNSMGVYKCYAVQWLIFLHIKANEMHASQLKCSEQYFDDKYANFGDG